MAWGVVQGDSAQVLKVLPSDAVDSLVTDPPAGIGFMGKEWDSDKGGRDQWIAWLTGIMRECLRIMKPGAHGLVWALPKTSHWTATALEDAGFEVRDVVTHHQGTGFPKSLDVSKAIDKAAGAEREIVGLGSTRCAYLARGEKCPGHIDEDKSQSGATVHAPQTAPATDAAKKWQGFGTALKPSSEHWILVRKPLIGTVAANVQAHGTGALNIDGCRIGTTKDVPASPSRKAGNSLSGSVDGTLRRETGDEDGHNPNVGRWPANVILSHAEECGDGDDHATGPGACAEGCPISEMDEQSGERKSGGAVSGQEPSKPAKNTYGEYGRKAWAPHGDTGGASRFFYCPKPSRRERDSGCEGVVSWESVDLSQETEDLLLLAKGTSEDTMRHLGALEWNTISYGKSTLEQSQKAIKSITRTITKLITDLRTSNSLQRLNTRDVILAATKTLMEAGSSPADLVALISRSKPTITSAVTASATSVALAALRGLQRITERGRRGNFHSTVKSIALMTYLIRLITPPGGLVLDPFCGSGSTGMAAVKGGWEFFGIEQDPNFHELAQARITSAAA